MAWLQLSWKLNILTCNEKSDEAGLQFAFVTIFDGTVRVDGHQTGNLFDANIGWPGNQPFGLVSSRNVPTQRNPFFGIVTRAVEYDNSGQSDRDTDYERFLQAVFNGAQDSIRSGGIPTATVLWRAGNSVALIDNFGDDDDKIGVSARDFPNYGNEISAAIRAEPRLPAGGTVMADTIRPIDAGFIEEDANYKLIESEIRIVTNNPDPSFP